MIARRAYGLLRAASLLGAVLAVLVAGSRAFQALHDGNAVFVAVAVGLALALGVMRPPVAHFERSSRPAPESARVGLITPLLLALLVVDGWFWAALANVATELVRPVQRRQGPLDRVLSAALRFPAWWAAQFLAPVLRAIVAGPTTPLALLEFTVLGAAFALLVDLLWIDALMAARQNRALARVWVRHLRDGATVLLALAEAAWAYVAARVALADGALGAAALVPLLVLAIVFVRFARTNARFHRLSLSRQAVDAMLRANDPHPQIRSLLTSIDPGLARESIEVVALGRAGGQRWSRLVRFGPAVPTALERLGARALHDVQATGDDGLFESDAEGSVRAFAAADAEGRLRGALVIFRAPNATPLVAERDLERAAAEIGPLLGELGAIDATRTAAAVDALTGLLNRRGIAHAFEEAIAYVRDGGRYAVMLLDVDDFKAINDLLGHATGDRVLAGIGRVLADNVRGFDVAARFGGEEFLVLLRDASRERALQVAERLRSAVETGGFRHADGKPVTVSVGVAYARAADGAAEVVDRADRALYRAKRAGRNRVVESQIAG